MTSCACARDLGYNVLEINSTHIRTRQNLLSILREATQSHRVGVATPLVAKVTDPTPVLKKKGLMAFFKPKEKHTTTMDEKSGCGGKQVTIETTTLMLLEEVSIACFSIIMRLYTYTCTYPV